MKTVVVVLALLTGCASLPEGLQMTDNERKACAVEGCAVFTARELRTLAAELFKRGFQAGQKRKGELSI